MELINLTALAKINRGTTPATRAKLEKMGVNPAQEVEMPSGRKFVLFDKVKAIKALEKSKAQREQEKARKDKEAEKKAAKAVVASSPRRRGRPSNDSVAKELQELRAQLAQLMDVVTRPQANEGAKTPESQTH